MAHHSTTTGSQAGNPTTRELGTALLQMRSLVGPMAIVPLQGHLSARLQVRF